MGNSYIRQETYTDGDVITAAHTNNEFDQIKDAFAASTGHSHDGTEGEGGPIAALAVNSITLGAGTTGQDVVVTFDGETTDGVKWMEDEDYFEFTDDILMATTEKLQFRDTAIYINSSTDGQLDLVADTEIQIAATTIDINGNVDISGTLTIGSAGISEAELEVLDGLTVSTAEVNILDGDTTATSTTVADADRVVLNDNGTMVQVAVTDLAAYFDDEITAMPNLTSVGTLSTLTVDNVIINGTTIGHTDDTDLITVASGLVTVAGEISVTTLDIGGTNVTSTATELNLLDGSTANSVVNSKAVIYGSSGELAGTLSTAAQTNITSVGTLSALTVDDVAVDGKVITMTGSSGDTATITAGTNGTLDIATTDGGGAAGNIQITADGTAELAGTTVTLDSEGGITLDANGGTITFADNGSSLGTITSDGYTGNVVGNVTGNVSGSAGSATGNAATATALATARNIGGTSFDGTGDIAVALASVGTAVTVADESSDTTCFPLFTTAATGDLPPKSGSNLTFNSSSGLLTATSFAGNLTGDVTGNADTATAATTVTVSDNESTNENNVILFGAGAAGSGNIGVEADGNMTYNPSTGKITATGFVGALTGDVTGNLTGTVATATQNSITTATGLTSTGALNAGSITSGFGTIDNGSSTITTTGTVATGAITAGGDLTRGGTVIGDGSITDTGDFTVDVVGDLILDAAGDDILLKSAGTHEGNINLASSNLTIKSIVSDKDIIFQGNDGGSGITALTLDMSAAGAATFNNDVTAFSDKRLKTDIKPITNSLDKVMQMQGVYYKRNDVEDAREQVGVLAQDMEAILPEVVLTADDEIQTKSVDYGKITSVLIEAIKELKAEIDELKRG